MNQTKAGNNQKLDQRLKNKEACLEEPDQLPQLGLQHTGEKPVFQSGAG